MSTPQRYRKKPVEIEAMLYDGINASEIMEWADASCDQGAGIVAAHDGDPGKAWHLLVGTLEGVMRADLGDWIIRGIAGEFYPCKPDIFEATYEPVEANPLGAAHE